MLKKKSCKDQFGRNMQFGTVVKIPSWDACFCLSLTLPLLVLLRLPPSSSSSDTLRTPWVCLSSVEPVFDSFLSVFPEPGQLPETPNLHRLSLISQPPSAIRSWLTWHVVTYSTHVYPPISPNPPFPPTPPSLLAQQGLESAIQPPLLSGPEPQAGPFVLTDKRKKAGQGRRINLSAGQTTHLLVVFVSFLSLPWFPLLSFYYLWWEQRILGRDAWWTLRAVTLL